MAEGKSNQAIAEELFLPLDAVGPSGDEHLLEAGAAGNENDHRRVLAVLTLLRH